MAHSINKLKKKLSPERHANIETRAKALSFGLHLQQIRQQRNLTQTEVSKLMSINQAALSKMEHQDDMLISTLEKLLEALGGQLKIVAEFPDGEEIVINQFETVSG